MHIVCIFALIHIYARACTKLLMIQAYERVKRAFCIYILIASSYVGRSLFFPSTSTLLFERNLILNHQLKFPRKSKTQSSFWMQIIFSWRNKSIKIVLKSFSFRKKPLDKTFAFWSAWAGFWKERWERGGATSQLLNRPLLALQLNTHISTYLYCML